MKVIETRQDRVYFSKDHLPEIYQMVYLDENKLRDDGDFLNGFGNDKKTFKVCDLEDDEYEVCLSDGFNKEWFYAKHCYVLKEEDWTPKIGMKVRVRPFREEWFNRSQNYANPMKEMEGEVHTIECIYSELIKISDGGWTWRKEWLEPVYDDNRIDGLGPEWTLGPVTEKDGHKVRQVLHNGEPIYDGYTCLFYMMDFDIRHRTGCSPRLHTLGLEKGMPTSDYDWL